MADNYKLEMLLPNIPNIELVAIEGLRRLANYLGINEEKIGEASVLVTESLINAFEHGSSNKAQIKIEFTLTKEKIIIFVEDYGVGFSPETVANPEIETKMGSSNKRGWGIKLMKSMSDDFIVESDSNGTKITMIKNLS